MQITAEMVDYVSSLARLRLPPEEKSAVAAELKKILDYMELINEADGLEVGDNMPPLYNVMRPDEAEPSLDRALLLANAPAHDGEAFLVPKTVEG